MKFAPIQSAIKISVVSEETVVRFSVHDNGPGVPIDYREGIFEKYKQVAAWKEGKRRGTGLGLAFCKLAVEAHKGSIGVECPNSGGSVFWFTLPQG
jgi:K+-sensing histidine kinase KdpD